MRYYESLGSRATGFQKSEVVIRDWVFAIEVAAEVPLLGTARAKCECRSESAVFYQRVCLVKQSEFSLSILSLLNAA